MDNSRASTIKSDSSEYELLTTKEAPYTDMVFYCKNDIRRWIVKPKKVYAEHNLNENKLRQVSFEFK